MYYSHDLLRFLGLREFILVNELNKESLKLINTITSMGFERDMESIMKTYAKRHPIQA